MFLKMAFTVSRMQAAWESPQRYIPFLHLFFYLLLFHPKAVLASPLGGFPDFYHVGGGRNLFAWHFDGTVAAKTPPSDGDGRPVILWLSGGPGCSSLLALFGENGPYRIDPTTGDAVPNMFSWTEAGATVIWLDQPVGTGYSYGGVPRHNTEPGVAEDVWTFLKCWFKKFSYEGRPLEIFGESYAGHYVPALAREILRRNDEATNYHLNLTGVAIGNGFTDPAIQYKYHRSYAKDNGLVSSLTLAAMGAALALCEPLVKGCNAGDDIENWAECYNAYLVCNMGLIMPVEATGVNPYDIRDQCAVKPLCYDFSPIDNFLARSSVREELKIPHGHRWSECNKVVDITMIYGGDWAKNFLGDVEEILGSGIEILVYAGEYDFICNWMGNQAWTEALSWHGAEGYANAQSNRWVTDTGVVAGSYKSYNGLTFLKVFNAGHLVPFDQPENSLDMVKRHLRRGFEGSDKIAGPLSKKMSLRQQEE